MTGRPVILPFRAFRYNEKKIGLIARVIAPPYDVITPDQQEALYKKSPYNIVRLDLRRGTNFSGEQNHYPAVAAELFQWIQDKILVQDSQPAIYLYEQDFLAPDGTKQTRRGCYALRRLEPFGEGTVFPHERTLAGPKKDRLALLKATGAHLSPIFGLFADPKGEAKALLAGAGGRSPLLACCNDTNQTHRLWAITDPQWISELTAALEGQSFLIADGHHRYETALAYAKWRDNLGTSHRPIPGLHHYVMMFCEAMDDPGLCVLPTHRLAKNLATLRASSFLEQVRRFFVLTDFSGGGSEWVEAVRRRGVSGKAFGLIVCGDPRYRIATLSPSQLGDIPYLAGVAEPLRSLDATIAHKCFLEGILGFAEEDQYNLERIAYLKSDQALVDHVQKGEGQVGILLNPPPLSQIAAIARAGQFMPPKTTYFYPKLPTGLLIHKID